MKQKNISSDFNLISHLEGPLTACISLESHETQAGYWTMRVQLFYEGETAGTTCFHLKGYSRQEAENIARTLHSNAYLMREIDEFLWGESD